MSGLSGMACVVVEQICCRRCRRRPGSSLLRRSTVLYSEEKPLLGSDGWGWMEGRMGMMEGREGSVMMGFTQPYALYPSIFALSSLSLRQRQRWLCSTWLCSTLLCSALQSTLLVHRAPCTWQPSTLARSYCCSRCSRCCCCCCCYSCICPVTTTTTATTT